MKGLWSILVASSAFAFIFSVATADAASIRVKCEKRSDRSRASVDGKDLVGVAGPLTGVLMSGSNSATTDAQDAVGDEVEFDFDSEADDIAEGATAIDASFIQGGQVTAKVVDSDGFTVVQDTVNCRIKD